MNPVSTYKNSGVDTDAADRLVDDIGALARTTTRPEVISGIGGFAGLFALSPLGYKKPVLVACTDGVGTKLKLAIDLNSYDGIGQDVVGMCVNDLICCGATPLFFLDYFATGKLDVEQCKAVIASMTRSLSDIRCALLGGETAEMPGFYTGKDFDIAGFSVGVVEEDQILTGKNIKEGDAIIGLSSSGPHSNGYSLIRHILTNQKTDLKTPHSFAPQGLGLTLLAPTKIYVNPVLKLMAQKKIRAMAHITGGGLVENLPRVFPENFTAVIDKKNVPTPEIFNFLKKQGNVPDDEMWRVFNMGIGFCLIVDQDQASGIVDDLQKMACPAQVIGRMEKQTGSQSPLVVLV